MARQRRAVAAAETTGLGGILASVGKAYADGEAWGGGTYIPAEGTYEAIMCNFMEEERTTDSGDPYAWFRVGLKITSGDAKVRGRETGVVFNTIPNAKGEHIGLRKLKGLTSVLNDGTAVDDLPNAVKYLRDCCEGETAVVFEVDSYMGVRDKKLHKTVEIIEEIGDAATDEEPEESEEPVQQATSVSG